MVDYKKMYAILCGAISDSLDVLIHLSDETAVAYARNLLQEALLKTEDLYIEATENDCKTE